MDTPTRQFVLGLQYHPRRALPGWLADYDAGEVRDDLQHIATLGITAVNFILHWEDVQPAPRRINGQMLRAFERALDLAAANGLQVLPTLFATAIDGTLYLPHWASRSDPAALLELNIRGRPAYGHPAARSQRHTSPIQKGQPRLVQHVFYEGGFHRNLARDPFTDHALHNAQQYQIDEVVGYFAQHPALIGWQIGAGLEYLYAPPSAEAAQHWLSETAERVRASSPLASVFGLTTRWGLLHPEGPRPEAIAESCAQVALSLELPLVGQERYPLELSSLAFSYGLGSALSGRPITVTQLGMPSAKEGETGWIIDMAYGQRTASYRASLQGQADYLLAALEWLRSVGAPGAWLAAYADVPLDLRLLDPWKQQIRAQTLGLLDAHGDEKPVVAALHEFSRMTAPGSVSAPTIALDPERYWQSPRQECARLWNLFQQG